MTVVKFKQRTPPPKPQEQAPDRKIWVQVSEKAWRNLQKAAAALS
jgi:hypothetical protein